MQIPFIWVKRWSGNFSSFRHQTLPSPRSLSQSLKMMIEVEKFILSLYYAQQVSMYFLLQGQKDFKISFWGNVLWMKKRCARNRNPFALEAGETHLIHSLSSFPDPSTFFFFFLPNSRGANEDAGTVSRTWCILLFLLKARHILCLCCKEMNKG